jgi:hypothetical protein
MRLDTKNKRFDIKIPNLTKQAYTYNKNVMKRFRKIKLRAENQLDSLRGYRH